MSNNDTIKTLTRIATQAGVTLKHPAAVTTLLDRKTAAAKFRTGTATPSLAHTIAQLDEEHWLAAILEHEKATAEAAAREQIFRTVPAVLDKDIERLVRNDVDQYLKQLHKPLAAAENALVESAQHLLARHLDADTAVSEGKGDWLTKFDANLTLLTSFGYALDHIAVGHRTTGLGGWSAPPTDIPTERRTVVDGLGGSHQLNTPDERQEINAARNTMQALNSPRDRRGAAHAIAQDTRYTIRAARTMSEFRQQSAAWLQLNVAEIVEHQGRDRFRLPTIRTL